MAATVTPADAAYIFIKLRALRRTILLVALTAGTGVFAQDKDAANVAKLAAISEADTMVMAPMRDGVALATDVYRPKGQGPFPAILVKTPYNIKKLEGGQLELAVKALERGYAFVVQNERGRYYSRGEWELLGNPRTDGYDSLSWIAQQPWSSGKVGTVGCSSSAEWQLALAALNHPAHAAMIPMAAGAGIGRMGEFQEQGNWYKGGVHQTLFSTWLYSVQQDIRPQFRQDLSQEQLKRLRKSYNLAAEMPKVEWAKQLRKLPMSDWLKEANDGPWADFIARTPADPRWQQGGLYNDNEGFFVPAYWFNSWFDVSQGPSFAMFNHVREKAAERAVREAQYMVVSPNLHCGFTATPEYEDLKAGELNVGRAWKPYHDMMFAFLDYYVKGVRNGFPRKTPRVEFYTMGRNAWASAKAWPPLDAKLLTLYLDSSGKANSVFGDGRLTAAAPASPGSDTFTYDPMNPVPSLGGGVCCNAGAALGGSFDQRGIEARADVLVYNSAPLERPLEVTGAVRAVLYVSSDAKDTDFTVKLVDVHPDGTAYNVDDTIFRARYREGYDRPALMRAGEVYELKPTPMSTSYEFAKNHRIRVEISSSKFPQYERNLNTGGNNYQETVGAVARNTLHHSAQHASRIVLPVRGKS